jgi:hypothetical protein
MPPWDVIETARKKYFSLQGLLQNNYAAFALNNYKTFSNNPSKSKEHMKSSHIPFLGLVFLSLVILYGLIALLS